MAKAKTLQFLTDPVNRLAFYLARLMTESNGDREVTGSLAVNFEISIFKPFSIHF